MLRATKMPAVMDEGIRDTATHDMRSRLDTADASRDRVRTAVFLDQAGGHPPVDDQLGVRRGERCVTCRLT
jgi:hypothetical protein